MRCLIWLPFLVLFNEVLASEQSEHSIETKFSADETCEDVEPEEEIEPVFAPDDLLPPVASVVHPDSVTAGMLVTVRIPRVPGHVRRRRQSHATLMVTASPSHELLFSDVYGNALHTLQSEHTKNITVFSTAASGSETLLATGSLDGSVNVYKLSSILDSPPGEPEESKNGGKDDEEEEEKKEKEKPKQPEPEPAHSLKVKLTASLGTYATQWVGFNAEADGDDEFPEDKGVAVLPAVTHVTIYTNRRHVLYVVGYSNGKIRTFSNNGTIKTELDVTTAPAAMELATSQQIAMATDSTMGLFRFGRGVARLDQRCDATQLGGVISLAYDETNAHTLYAGTRDGRLLVFNLRDKRKHAYCTPKHTLTVEEGAPLQLEAMNGYLLVASPSALHVYNITAKGREPPVRAMMRTREGPVPLLANPVAMQLSIASLPFKEVFVAVVHPAAGHVQTFQSELPWADPKAASNMGMVRAPLFVGGLIMMVMYQLYKKKRGGGGGGMGGFDPSDPQFMRDFAAFEKGGGRGMLGKRGMSGGIGGMGGGGMRGGMGGGMGARALRGGMGGMGGGGSMRVMGGTGGGGGFGGVGEFGGRRGF